MSLSPRASKNRCKGIAWHFQLYFRHDDAVRQGEGLCVDLRAAYHPGVGRIHALRQCILQRCCRLRALRLPIRLPRDHHIQATWKGAELWG